MRDDVAIMRFEDYRGNKVERTVNQTIDIRNFEGTAGYAWLVMAANMHLSQEDIVRYLEEKAGDTPGVARTRSWVQRRVWMFRPRGTVLRGGPLPNRDGNHGRALKIMAAHPKLSLMKLVRRLKEHGISRSKEWCRLHRCDGVAGGDN